MRRYHWGCHRCGVRLGAVSMDGARQTADEHDQQHHKGKPVSFFGWARRL